MKLLLVVAGFLLPLYLLLAADAPRKLALIGESALAELTAARLSGDGELVLLERSEIAKVLREHEFSGAGLTGRKLIRSFPHADFFAVLEPQRLVVFNAKNGFRLADCAWRTPEEATPETVCAEIRRAAAKLAERDPVYLSSVSVRNVGVPKTQSALIDPFVDEVERMLLKCPAVQVLERARLGTVTDERKLTGELFALTPSARLLTFEFEPAAGEAIKLKLLIRTTGDKPAGTVEYPDVFTHTPEAVRSVCGSLTGKLAEGNVPAEADRLAEAKRYIGEYMRLVRSQGSGQSGELEKFRSASGRLFAALSLAPENERIRYAELIYHSKLLRAVPVAEGRLAASRAQFERMKKFHADFPESRSGVFDVTMLFGECLTKDFSEFPPELKTGYAALCREMRRLGVEEMKRLYYPFDLSDGIGSLKELTHLRDVVIRSNWDFYHYCDSAGWLKQRLADYATLYREADQYLQTHPDESEKINKILREGYLTTLFFSNQPLDIPMLSAHLEETRELCEFIENSRLDSVKPMIYQLDAMREAIREISTENFTRAIERCFERIAALNPRLLQPRQGVRDQNLESSGLWVLRDFCRQFLKRDTLPDRLLKAYQEKHGMHSEFEELERVVMMFLRARSKEAFPQLLKMAPAMKKFNIQHLKSNNFGNAYGSVAEHLFFDDSRKGYVGVRKMEFFRELNSAFEIETGNYQDLPGLFRIPGSGERFPHLLGAAQQAGEVLLFFSDERIVVRGRDGKWEPPIPAGANLTGRDRSGDTVLKLPLAISDTHFAFVDTGSNLRIYDRQRRTWNVCRDFSTQPVRSLLIHGGRIYALAGDEEWAVHNRCNYMLSVELDGTGRKLLFSSERSEKLTELDKLRGGLSGLTARSENELVFLLSYTNNYTQIWSYNIRENRFRMLFRMPWAGTDCDYLWKGGDDAIYCTSCSWMERIYRIPQGSDRAEWIFCQSGGRKKSDPPDAAPAFFKGGAQLRGPWLVTGDYLWCGGGTSAFLNLKRIEENPPLLLLPKTDYVFELADGRILFLGAYRWFIVTPPAAPSA